MNIELRCEITKVEPAVTKGKDEAPRRFTKLTLSRLFDPGLARELNAEATYDLIKAGDLAKATIGIDRLSLKGTFKGLGRGTRQGTVAMQMRGVAAKVVGSDSDDGPMVKLSFDLDYSEAWMVFLAENLGNTVDVTLQDLQLENALVEPNADDWSSVMPPDDPTQPEDPPKKKRGRRKNGAEATGNA